MMSEDKGPQIIIHKSNCGKVFYVFSDYCEVNHCCINLITIN